MVGAFRREIAAMMSEPEASDDSIVAHLQADYHTNEDGARAICEYFTEQCFVTGEIPSDRQLLVEHFRDELGQLQVVIHSPFGIRVHDPWAMALGQAFEERYGARPVTATVDDGILLTFSKEAEETIGTVPIEDVTNLVTPETVDALLTRALRDSPIFNSRFRHNAVRSLMILREYKGTAHAGLAAGAAVVGAVGGVSGSGGLPPHHRDVAGVHPRGVGRSQLAPGPRCSV